MPQQDADALERLVAATERLIRRDTGPGHAPAVLPGVGPAGGLGASPPAGKPNRNGGPPPPGGERPNY